MREPGGRGQPQRGADGDVAGGAAGGCAGGDDQPAVRVGPGCGGDGGAGAAVGRGGADAGRRRRVDDAGAVRAGQGDRGLRAHCGDLRHDDRVAFRERADEDDARHGQHAGDRRERGRAVPGDAAVAGCVRVAESAEGGGGAGSRVLCTGDRAADDQGAEGRPRWWTATSTRAGTRRWRCWRS